MNTFDYEFNVIRDRYLSGEHIEYADKLKKELMARPVVLYGVGYFKKAILNNLEHYGVPVECFCDSFKTGVDAETNLPIISTDELALKYPQANVVITAAAPNAQNAITDKLFALGFGTEQIFTFGQIYKLFRTSATILSRLTLEDFLQYCDGYAWAYDFFKDDRSKQIILEKIKCYLFNDVVSFETQGNSFFSNELSLSDNEVLVEGGVCTGGATRRFIDITNNAYKHIYGFEIDPENSKKAKINLASYSNIDIATKGLWSFSGAVKAELTANGGSRIKECGGFDAGTISLDDMFAEMPVSKMPTFIVLDIEGSEKEALIGAQRIIRDTRPKLAICAYFHPEYIYELPKMTHKFNSDYRFILRQYSPYLWDTVMYAY